MFAFDSGKYKKQRENQKSMKEILHINDEASKKIKMIGSPKTVKTFTNFLSIDTELMQESATQLTLIMPKDVFDSSEDLKSFFEDGVAETINMLQKQTAVLKIVGKIGGVVKEGCKGIIQDHYFPQLK